MKTMDKKVIDKAIKEHLEVKFTYVDLFYAYCRSKGYEDVESDVTEEEYEALETEFESKISYGMISLLGRWIVEDGMERINFAMDALANS